MIATLKENFRGAGGEDGARERAPGPQGGAAERKKRDGGALQRRGRERFQVPAGVPGGDTPTHPLCVGATYTTVPVHPGPLGCGYICYFDEYDSALQENMGDPPCIAPLFCG
eukprot:1176811-Prorocentrum_minimum.AAC.1